LKRKLEDDQDGMSILQANYADSEESNTKKTEKSKPKLIINIPTISLPPLPVLQPSESVKSSPEIIQPKPTTNVNISFNLSGSTNSFINANNSTGTASPTIVRKRPFEEDQQQQQQHQQHQHQSDEEIDSSRTSKVQKIDNNSNHINRTSTTTNQS